MIELVVSEKTASDLAVIAAWNGVETCDEMASLLIREMVDDIGLVPSEKNVEPMKGQLYMDLLPERDQVVEPEGTEREKTSSSIVDLSKLDKNAVLDHTKVRRAFIDGKVVERNGWCFAVAAMVQEVMNRNVPIDEIIEMMGSRYVVKGKHKNGMLKSLKYYDDMDICIYSFAANRSWREIDRMAKKWDISVRIEIQWSENPRAAYPGLFAFLNA